MDDTMIQEEAINMSNEQAVQILIPMRNMMCDQHGCPISDAVFALDKAIEALSADRPQGEWILECDAEGEGDNLYRCSECGRRYGCQEYDLPNFCSHCGVRMK